jgi:hypothetical protein
MGREVKDLIREIVSLCPKALERKHMSIENFQHLKEIVRKHKIKEERLVVAGNKVKKEGGKVKIERSPGVWVDGEIIGVAGDGRLEVKLAKLYRVSYRDLCGLARAYLLKEHHCLLETRELRQKTCRGGICCQATTQGGKRCTRRANDWTTWDLARRFQPRDILATYSGLSSRVRQKTKLTMSKSVAWQIYVSIACVQCCFFCWQHAAIEGIGRGLGIFATVTSSELYYLTHFDQILSVFFSKVEAIKKASITVAIKSVGAINAVGTMLIRALGIIQSWWGFFADAMFYMLMLIIVKAAPSFLKAVEKVFGKATTKMLQYLQALALKLLAFVASSGKSIQSLASNLRK